MPPRKKQKISKATTLVKIKNPNDFIACFMAFTAMTDIINQLAGQTEILETRGLGDTAIYSRNRLKRKAPNAIHEELVAQKVPHVWFNATRIGKWGHYKSWQPSTNSRDSYSCGYQLPGTHGFCFLFACIIHRGFDTEIGLVNYKTGETPEDQQKIRYDNHIRALEWLETNLLTYVKDQEYQFFYYDYEVVDTLSTTYMKAIERMKTYMDTFAESLEA